MKPTTKSSGPKFRQARMEGHYPAASAGTSSPMRTGGQSVPARPGQKSGGEDNQRTTVSNMGYGPGLHSKPGKATAPMAGNKTEVSIGKTKSRRSSTTINPGPTGIGISGRGAPRT